MVVSPMKQGDWTMETDVALPSNIGWLKHQKCCFNQHELALVHYNQGVLGVLDFQANL